MAEAFHSLTTRVKLLQKIVLMQHDKCLVVKRSSQAVSRPGKWDLPGGNVEWPNTAVSAANLHMQEAVRELKEETGVVLAKNQITEPCYVGTYFDAKKQVFTMVLGWKVHLTSQPEIKLSDEHTEFAWISRPEVETYDFGFAGEKDGFIRLMLENSFGIQS